MTAALDSCSLTAIQIVRAAPLFDRLVDAVLEHRASRAPARGGPAGPEPGTLDRLRERLDWFFPKFRELYFDLLREQLGPELPLVLSALQDERVQRFFRALEAMRPALLRSMQQLGGEMTNALAASELSAYSGSPSAV